MRKTKFESLLTNIGNIKKLELELPVQFNMNFGLYLDLKMCTYVVK